jgi:Ca-activated chloride channel homolog
MLILKNHKKHALFIGVILITVIIGTNFLTAFSSIPKPNDIKGNSLSWDLKLDNQYLMQGSKENLAINLKIKGGEISISERPPLNLVLVLDRSGSMSDMGKLDYAKDAAKQIINNLSTKDRLGIVVYSDNAQTLLPIKILNNKDNAKSLVNSLYPTNSTNLSAGLVEGIRHIESVIDKEYINRVILLSDGLANAGITNINEINNISREASLKGISITTMGLGASYDENMLTNIAEHGTGNYYYIESPTLITSIFAREFGQLIKTVAKNPKINLEFPLDIKIIDIYGYKYIQDGNNVEINPGDISSGQERNIIIELGAPTDKLGTSKLVKASLEFEDVLNKYIVSENKDLDYKVTKNKQIVLNNVNKNIEAKITSVNAAVELYTAAKDYEKGNSRDAVSRIKKSLAEINRLNNSTLKSESTMVQEEVLRQALDDISISAPAPNTKAGKSIIKKYKAESREQQK